MFREFTFLLCATALACAAPAQSKAPASGSADAKSVDALGSAATKQDLVALPSASYQSVVAPTNKYLPTQQPQQVYEVNSAVVDTITGPSKTVYVQSYGQPQNAVFSSSVAVDPSSSEYSNVLERYVGNVAPIKPYYAVPIPTKTVTIESQKTVNALPSVHVGYSQNVGHAVSYAGNAAQGGSYSVSAVPLTAAKSVTVESHPQQVASNVAYVQNVAPARQSYAVPAENIVAVRSQGVFEAHSSAAQPVNQVRTIVHQVPQYVPAPKITYAVNPTVETVAVSAVPVVSKKVAVEAYNSVTAHPPTAPKYALVRYYPEPIVKPVPVPVIYKSSAVETQYPTAQQYAVVSKSVAPTAASFVQAPIRVQPTPVPVHSGSVVQYQPVAVPVVHGGSFVEKVYAPVGPTPTPASPQHGYSRAVVFSPASEVSRVTFNGLGVSYGW